MDDPHVLCLSRLFDENGLATGPVRKTVLVVVDGSAAGPGLDDAKRYFADDVGPAVEFATVADVVKNETQTSEYDAIVSGVIGNGVPCDFDLFSAYTGLLRAKGGGALIVKTDEASDATEKTVVKRLKICGFVNVAPSATSGTVVGYTPAYQVGSSDKVALHPETKDNVISAWKSDDYNGETISEDDLLEADDLIRPVSSSLRVCATTKKAKACKDCSCGLAEELEANRLQDGPKAPAPDTSNAKSSCGSCYLGDAFRCASCPYLGMPAFKPGEKVQLAGNLLQDDF